MSWGRITVIWKSFKEVYPNVLIENSYNHFKSSDIEVVCQVKHNFLSEFFGELFFILLAILCLIADSYNWYLKGGLVELLSAGFLIIGIGVTLSFIPSSISFAASYINTKILFKRLNNNLKRSISYEDFCNLMSNTDKRYVMELKRLEILDRKVIRE